MCHGTHQDLNLRVIEMALIKLNRSLTYKTISHESAKDTGKDQGVG